MRATLSEIPGPPAAPVTPLVAAVGRYVPEMARLQIMSPGDWELFVLEWVDSLRTEYARVQRHAGPGDMGLDIVAFVDERAEDPWDNYQCKHYANPLTPSDIWPELGKIASHTFQGDYSLPRQYVFVAPQGAGISAKRLTNSPALLRQGLLDHWGSSCERAIAATPIPLTAQLRAHIESIDFSFVSCAEPVRVLDAHRRTRWHAARFGGGLPYRGPDREPPDTIQLTEDVYVRALLDAYEDRLQRDITDVEAIADGGLSRHLARSRREFYCAESLREFSRDNVPPGAFEGLLDEVDNGVADTAARDYNDGYSRVLAVVEQAKRIDLSANALQTVARMNDRGGMCHQLANDRRLTWRR